MFGSHLSIAGGMHKAVLEAVRLGFDTVQVFTKNQQQWRVPPLSEKSRADWQYECQRVGFDQVVSHDSYLINLASPDPDLRKKSIELFTEELVRCDLLAIPYLVTHPGAHMGPRDDQACEIRGCERVAEALDLILGEYPDSCTTICLEVTAGQGSGLGYRLEHLSTIIQQTRYSDRLGVCLDTAHLFAAGYDFRGEIRYKRLMKQIDTLVGLERVKVWHLNDSKKPLGSRVDRHDHIGLGTIGEEGFKPIVKDKRWRDTPKILETPKLKHPDGRDWDTVNLERLKSWLK